MSFEDACFERMAARMHGLVSGRSQSHAVSVASRVGTRLYMLHLQANDIAGNVITHNAVINACGKGQQWQQALQLMATLPQRKLQANVVSYSSATCLKSPVAIDFRGHCVALHSSHAEVLSIWNSAASTYTGSCESEVSPCLD